MSLEEFEKEADSQKEEEIEKEYPFKAIPTIKYYQKTYANGCANNDKKAMFIFKEYESTEKIKRLKTELTAVAQEKVSPKLLDSIAGPARRGRFGSYEQWAKITLTILLQGK